MLDNSLFAVFCENLMGEKSISDRILYSHGTEKVEDIFLKKDSKFYVGKYKYGSFDDEYICLVKKVFLKDKYLLTKDIRHPNIVTLISYDLAKQNVLVEYMEKFGSFQSYMGKYNAELIDHASGKFKPKFINFIRVVLTTLQYLYDHSLAHGHLKAKHIYVKEQEGQHADLDVKLFEIGVRLNQDSESIKYARNHDFCQLGALIREVIGDGNQNHVDLKFCEYLEAGQRMDTNYEITMYHVLNHPALTKMTEKDMAAYIEKVIESGDVSSVNKSNITWLDDHETVLRMENSYDSTMNPYLNDAWSFVRLVRNSVKHYKKYHGTSLDMADKYAYLKHVNKEFPTFMLDLYTAMGDVGGNYRF